MLAFVPVTLDFYRSVRRHLHWTLQNLVAFADRTGRCFPSVRTLAAATGQPRSTVSRHLAQIGQGGHHHTPAAPGWRLRLRDRGPLPPGTTRGVPPARRGCPTAENRRTIREENQGRASAIRGAKGQLRRDPRRAQQVGSAAAVLAQVPVLAATVGRQARRGGLHGPDRVADRLIERP